MAYRSMMINSTETDKLYIKRGCLVLKNLLFFSLYSFSCIAKRVTTLKQLRFISAFDSADTNFVYPVLITISHFCKHYRLRPNPPITLEWVLHNVPNIECPVNTVWPPVLILSSITVERLTVISRFATSAAAIMLNRICLHLLNGCSYCHEPCSARCWVCLTSNHHWIDNCDDCDDELPPRTGFDIHQFPHGSPDSNANVQQQLYFPNQLIWSCWNHLSCFQTQTLECLR